MIIFKFIHVFCRPTTMITSLDFLASVQETSVLPVEFLFGDRVCRYDEDVISQNVHNPSFMKKINNNIQKKTKNIIDKYYSLDKRYANICTIKEDIINELEIIFEKTPENYIDLEDDELRESIKRKFKGEIRNIVGILFHMTSVDREKLDSTDMSGKISDIELRIIDFVRNNVREEYIDILGDM